jgi:GDPmannose 4,6-dehydratase
MFACNGILFNHESPIRGETFVTRKITRATAKIVLGMQEKLFLGNLDSQRDWGHAKDYVEAMYLMLQQDKPEDFVIATGKTTYVRDFVKMAFADVGITVAFKGQEEKEVGVVEAVDKDRLHFLELDACCKLTVGQEIVAVDPRYFRPTEVDLLIGDAKKAEEKLGWKAKYSLQELVNDMMRGDLKAMKKEKFLKDSGFRTLNYFE